MDAYANPPPSIEVVVRSDRTNRLLGTGLPVAEIGQIVRRVSASVKSMGRRGYRCRPPSYRSDLTREVDFIEEVARLAGYDRVPATQPQARLTAAPDLTSWRMQERVRESLAAQGMHEMTCHRFVPGDWNGRIAGLAPPASTGVRLLNPMTAEAPEMRRSLLPNLLAAAAHNRRQGESWIRAFEIGNVFWTTDEIRESRAVDVASNKIEQRRNGTTGDSPVEQVDAA